MKYSSTLGKCTLLLLALLLSVGISHAQEMSLNEAKSAGLIGEGRDGYIALVQQNVPEQVRELVQRVNRERRERYQEIANENDVALRDVARLAYARAVEATQPGHFVQDDQGNWLRK